MVNSAPGGSAFGLVTWNQPSGTQTVSGSVTATQATGSNLHVVVDTAPTTTVTGSGNFNAVGTTTDGTTTETNFLVVGGESNDATAQYQPLPLGTTGRSLIVEGFSGGTAVPVSGTFFQGTQPVSGTVTANQGTANTAANSWQVEVTDGTNVLGVSAHPLRVDPTGTTTQPVSLTSTTITGTVAENLTQVATTTLGTPQTFGTAPTGVVIGTSSDIYVAGTRARSNQTTTAAGVLDVNVVGSLGVTNSVTNGTFAAITDNVTKAGVIAATTALKTDMSSVAGTATGTAAAGVQKVGISGSTAATLDSTIGAATAPTNALATSTVYQTTVPALTAGQAVAVQCDTTGSTAVNTEGRKASYRTGNSALTSVAGVSIFVQGSASKTIRVTRLVVSYISTTTTEAYHVITLNRYSALSGGTNVADTIGKLDTNNAVATAVVDHVTVVNTTQTKVATLGVENGVAQSSTTATSPTPSGQPARHEFIFGDKNTQGCVLRGTGDFLGVLFDAATCTYNYYVEWVEDNS